MHNWLIRSSAELEPAIDPDILEPALSVTPELRSVWRSPSGRTQLFFWGQNTLLYPAGSYYLAEPDGVCFFDGYVRPSASEFPR